MPPTRGWRRARHHLLNLSAALQVESSRSREIFPTIVLQATLLVPAPGKDC
jgi:hypothetical protein